MDFTTEHEYDCQCYEDYNRKKDKMVRLFKIKTLAEPSLEEQDITITLTEDDLFKMIEEK